MKIFLSWSKDLSRNVAQYFSTWLPGVIQECSSPFISADIDKGEPWFETITGNLGSTDLGLVFITAENQDAVWLNFEAGAMLNKFGKSGICPILVGLKKGDYDGPLKNLQLTELSNEDDVKLLLGTINKKCANPLDQVILDRMLGYFWPELQNRVSELTAEHAKIGHTTNAKRDVDDKVDELLSLVRGLASKESVAESTLLAQDFRQYALGKQARSFRTSHDLWEKSASLQDAISDQAYDRFANQEDSRRERLERFTEEHGSCNLVLKSSGEEVTLVDVWDIGFGKTELVIAAKNSKNVQIVSMDEVTVIPF